MSHTWAKTKILQIWRLLQYQKNQDLDKGKCEFSEFVFVKAWVKGGQQSRAFFPRAVEVLLQKPAAPLPVPGREIGSGAGFVTRSPGCLVMWPWIYLQQGEAGLHKAGELFKKPNTFPAPQQGKLPGREQLQPAAPQRVTWPRVPLAVGFLCTIPSSSLCMPS